MVVNRRGIRGRRSEGTETETFHRWYWMAGGMAMGLLSQSPPGASEHVEMLESVALAQKAGPQV